jgi:hypothetical protein
MTPSLSRSKKAAWRCSGVSSPLYTSAMEEEEEEDCPVVAPPSLLPGASTERSAAVTRARLAPRRTWRATDLWICMANPAFLYSGFIPLSTCIYPDDASWGTGLLTGVCSFAGHGGCRRWRSTKPKSCS